MTRTGKATRGFIYYLRRYLEQFPEQRAPLRRYHRETTGRSLHHGNLFRYLSFQQQPTMDTTFALLFFLHDAGELKPGKQGEGLFAYARPELLRAPAKARPAVRKPAGSPAA